MFSRSEIGIENRGWQREGKFYRGYYRTIFGSFQGKVRLRLTHVGDFFLRHPPPALRAHSHWVCFSSAGSGWYSVHFNSQPKTLEDGIKSLERLLERAFRQQLGKEEDNDEE